MTLAPQPTRGPDAGDVLRDFIENLPDPVYTKDIHGRFLSANPATLRFLGAASEEDLIGRSDFDLFPADVAAGFFTEEQEVLRTGRMLVDREATVVAPTGRTWCVLTTKSVLRDGDGRAVGTIGINRDVTELKRTGQELRQALGSLARREEELLAALRASRQAQEELEQAQQKLVEAEKMTSVARLAAGIAHEVKNPLAVVSAGLDYLARCQACQAEQVPMVLQRMRAAVVRADGVVRGLLDLSVPRVLDARPCDLNAAVAAALSLVNHEVRRCHVRVHVELDPTLPRLSLDGPKIEQVLVNLYLNALQAMGDGGTLSVRTGQRFFTRSGSGPARGGGGGRGDGDGDGGGDGSGGAADPFKVGDAVAVVEVEDTGPGIAVDNLSRVFEPFFTTKPAGKGTGLGLAVSRAIVGMHGGTLEVTNRAEGGVRATIRLRI